jgi:hypothetical protein
MLGHNHLAEPNWHVLIFLYPIMFLEAQQQTRPDKQWPPPKSSPMGRGPAGVSSAHNSVWTQEPVVVPRVPEWAIPVNNYHHPWGFLYPILIWTSHTQPCWRCSKYKYISSKQFLFLFFLEWEHSKDFESFTTNFRRHG